MRLQTLNLSHNAIYKFEEGGNVGLKTLLHLKHIYLAHNHLESLKLFKHVEQVQHVDICENHISSLLELYYMKSMMNLVAVYMKGNPVTEKKHYYETCLEVSTCWLAILCA